ncbi:cytochrome P450 [Thelephora terrestris]|uniref:Cytochrome P450 n=1 Tax=Thelephora terrestris TaxID=56493 RepID=A0A9P6HD14_9AGAM|nr:cytochrome P450 [Thelephora terrestris]
MRNLDPLSEVPVDPMVVIVSSALVTHLYFKRYEPQSPVHALSILLGIPSLLSLLSVDTGRNPASALPTRKVFRTFVVYFATLIGSIAAYRVSPFHPLAKHPGPFMAKLSKLWMVIVCWTGKPHECFARLHEKYGDIVRTGPNEVIVRDPAAIQPLMGTTGWGKGACESCRMPSGPPIDMSRLDWSSRTMNAPIPPLIGVRDGPTHAKRRRTWNRGFNPAAMREYEPMVHKRVLELTEVLAQRGRVDLSAMFGYYTFDVMADIGLGGGTSMISEGNPEDLLHIIAATMRTANVIAQIPWIARYLKALPGAGADLKLLQAFSMKRYLARKAEGCKKKDLYYHLADEAGIEKQPIPVPIILTDAALVVIAGSETTATVLSSLFFYLLRDPEKFERLRAEIDKFCPRGDEITVEHFDEMHYLEACINEAMRLSPPVPSGSQRAALHPDPSQGKMLGPYYIPEGTLASVNFLGIQRDPKNFSPFPNNFWPDRWLVAKSLIECPVPEGEFVHETSAFVPFSFGPGSCVGKPLAMLELRMTTAYLVRDLDFKFAPGYKETWEADWRDHLTMQRGELPVFTSPRA